MKGIYNGYHIEIRKDIPFPEAFTPTSIMKQMKVGDSVFIPGLVTRKVTNFSSQIRQQEEFANYRYSARKVEEEVAKEDGTMEKVEGVRIWRVEDNTEEDE